MFFFFGVAMSPLQGSEFNGNDAHGVQQTAGFGWSRALLMDTSKYGPNVMVMSPLELLKLIKTSLDAIDSIVMIELVS